MLGTHQWSAETMPLLGLVGKKLSGKTTAAKYLVSSHGWEEWTFAECLKQVCITLFRLDPDQVYGTEEQKNTPDPRWFGCTPRKMLQYVGTDLLRNKLDEIMPGLGTKFFVHHINLRYQQAIAQNPGLRVLLSDVRFLNEAEMIKGLGGILIKLVRDNGGNVDTHLSEMEVDMIPDIDHTIDNNHDLIQLHLRLEEAIL